MSLLDTTGGMLPRRAAPDDRRRRMGDLLADAGVITHAQLQQALEAQKAPGPRRRLGEMLIALGFVDERDIAVTLAEQLGLDTLDLSTLAIDPAVVRRLPQQLSERSGTVVVQQLSDGRYIIAMSDPTNVLALDDVRLTLGADVLPIIAIESQIRDQLRRAWGLSAGGDGLTEMVSGIGEEIAEDLGSAGVDDAPTVQLVNKIFHEAVQLNASDIHVETQRDSLRVRFRIDGILRDVMTAPRKAAGAVLSRIKIVSGLDIAERRDPPGRPHPDRRGRRPGRHPRVDAAQPARREGRHPASSPRATTCPSLDVLGFEPDQLDAFRRALHTPQGLVLITGPTGSGKTNTLYAGIAEILDPEKNIVTLEDPVEVQLPGITQVQVNNKAGHDLPGRPALGAAPGPGHRPGRRGPRRRDLRARPQGRAHRPPGAHHAAHELRRGRPHPAHRHGLRPVPRRQLAHPRGGPAAGPAPLPAVRPALRARRGPARPARAARGGPARTRPRAAATGCADCGHTGYRGRTAVYEVLTVDAEMRRILVRDPSEEAVLAQAKVAGMQSLRASALAKAMDGRTTFEEVLRVTTTDSTGGSACPACARPVERGMVACPWCAAELEAARCQGCAKELRARVGGVPVVPHPAARGAPAHAPDGRATPRARHAATDRRPTGDEPAAAPAPGRGAARHGSYPGRVTSSPTPPSTDAVRAALATVDDPEIRRPVTELGMVKDVVVAPRRPRGRRPVPHRGRLPDEGHPDRRGHRRGQRPRRA